MNHQPNITVPEAFDAFLLARKSENVVASTLDLYRWTLKTWLERWPDVPLEAITPDHIRAFLLWLHGSDTVPNPRQYKSATVSIQWRNLRAFLRWCEAEGLLNGSKPLRNLKSPKVEETKPDVLTEWEALELLQRTKAEDGNGYRNYAMMLFFLITGARLAELNTLNVDDLNLQQGYARLKGKGRRERIVPLFDVLPGELKLYILRHRHADRDERALFVADHGRRFHRVSIQQIVIERLQWYVPRALTKTGPHTLRHTACTFLLRRLVDIKRVATIMGHSNLETTEGYVHLSFDDLNGTTRPTLDELIRRTKRARRKAGMLAVESGV